MAFQDGFERLLSGVESDEFEFLVNDECLKNTVFEAILISPPLCSVHFQDIPPESIVRMI
jgi:hypothetical protein